MNQLIIRLVIPLTVISFATITKWWYTFPVDAPDTLYIGFPFPFVGDGWHTSMSLQFFILEFLVDFTFYFFFWLTVVFCVSRILTNVQMHTILTIGLWTISGLIIFYATYIASFSENVFLLKRGYEMEIMETGYKFVWQRTERPDYYKNQSKEKK
jgi:hypothetical protein